MRYNEVAPIPKQMTIVTGLCVVGLMAFGLAISYYKNILFDQQLTLMEERNEKLKGEITGRHSDLQYLQSVQYKDKYAKENFGLLRPGEKVLLVSIAKFDEPLMRTTELTEEEKRAIYEEHLRNIRIIDQWSLYLFHRDQIDDLKKEIE